MQFTVVALPALSPAVRDLVLTPAVVVSAAAETVGRSGPEVASLTDALITPEPPSATTGAGEAQLTVGGVLSTLTVTESLAAL